jgi:Domain of unknown function (DUF4926)
MAFKPFEDVILTADVGEHELRVGDVGTVVEHHHVAGREDGYSVEFFDMTGRTIAVVVVPGSKLRLPTTSDRPSVRTPAKAHA